MKRVLLFLLLSIGFNSYSQEAVILEDVAQTKLDYSLVYLDVMPYTPKNNFLKIKLKKLYDVCNESRSREVYAKSFEHCGYDLAEKIMCNGEFRDLPGVDYYTDGPIKSDNPYVSALRDILGGPNYNPGITDQRSMCKKFDVPVARTCHFTETFCLSPERKEITEYRDFKLRLVNFPERALIRLELNESEELSLNVLNIYSECVSTKTYFRNGKVIGAKIKLRYSCYAALKRY